MSDVVKVDRRIEKTRKCIFEAFKKMIIEMEYKDITVKSLAEAANINRKTFYLHYESLDEILYDLALELSDDIFASLNDNNFFATDGFKLEIFASTLQAIVESNYNLTKKLVSASSYRFFSRNIKDLVKESFIRKLRNKVSLPSYLMNISGDYIASGMSKILSDWFNDPGDYTLKQICEVCGVMVFGSITSLSKYVNRNESSSIFM